MTDRKIHEGEQHVVEQTRIWDYFQSEGVGAFLQSRPRLKFIVNRIDPGSKSLNIGVGGAILEELALRKGIDIHSLDPDERAIEKLRDRYGMDQKAKIGYSDNIPFSDEVFDIVVMSEVLEHLGEVELDNSIREVVRVLKHNGAFIATVPFRENLADNDVICPHCAEKFHRWGHQQSFSVNRLKKLLEERGLSIDRIEVRCFPDWSRKGLANTLKSCFRYVLGRFQVGIAQPNIFIKTIKK